MQLSFASKGEAASDASKLKRRSSRRHLPDDKKAKGKESNAIKAMMPVPHQRRKRQPWTDEETKMLLNGVHRFGRGNWAIIHQQMGFSSSRTTTDIKDKWRNLIDTRLNARTPRDLKILAESINSEQIIVSPVTKHRVTAEPSVSFCDDEDTVSPYRKLMESAEIEMLNQPWDTLKYNEEWEC